MLFLNLHQESSYILQVCSQLYHCARTIFETFYYSILKTVDTAVNIRYLYIPNFPIDPLFLSCVLYDVPGFIPCGVMLHSIHLI